MITPVKTRDSRIGQFYSSTLGANYGQLWSRRNKLLINCKLARACTLSTNITDTTAIQIIAQLTDSIKELTYSISTQIITSLTTNEEEREAIKARVRKKESKA